MANPIIKLYHQEELDTGLIDEDGTPDETKYELRMYGMDEMGKEYVLFIDGIHPSFWLKVSINWANTDTKNLITDLRARVGKNHERNILGGKNPKCWETHLFSKLYGFDNYKKHKFIKLNFKTIKTMRKTKSLWFKKYPDHGILLSDGFRFRGNILKIYECNLPTMLIYFHKEKILTSGWITFNKYIKPKNRKLIFFYKY